MLVILRNPYIVPEWFRAVCVEMTTGGLIASEESFTTAEIGNETKSELAG